MIYERTELLSLPALARTLKLPLAWLKKEAEAGNLPCLRVGRRLLFNNSAVVEALLDRAAKSQDSEGAE